VFGGTTTGGGANMGGTVFQIAKTADGYSNVPNILVSFSGKEFQELVFPVAGLTADANGDLFGTTLGPVRGPRGRGLRFGAVYEITNSGFVIAVVFAGKPGKANCHGKSVSALAKQYGGLNNAAVELGYRSVSALQTAIKTFCEA